MQKMLRYSVPPGYQRQQAVKRPKLGPWLGVIDAILEEDKSTACQATAHRQADLRAAKSRAWILRRLHHREGLRSYAELRSREMFVPLDACAGRSTGGLRRGAGGGGRSGAEGALSGDGFAALR